MPKLIKRVVPTLLLVAILSLSSFYGCSSYTPSTMPWTGIAPENLTQQQWQDILTVALEYHEHLDTYNLAIMTSADTDAAGGSNPWELSLNTSITGFRNLAEEQTQMTMQKSMILKGLGQDGEQQGIVYNMYAPDDWLYVSMAATDLGSDWIKVKKNSEVENALYFNVAEEQLQLLKTPSSIEYLKTEYVNDIECYILSISPDKNELATWLDSQDTGLQNLDWQKVVNDANSFKDFTLTCYLAKDSYLVMRISMNMILEFTPEQAGATTLDFDSIQSTLYMDIMLYDHNIPYTITLPADAGSAKEVSSDIFLN
jgi:hypothetical protein